MRERCTVPTGMVWMIIIIIKINMFIWIKQQWSMCCWRRKGKIYTMNYILGIWDIQEHWCIWLQDSSAASQAQDKKVRRWTTGVLPLLNLLSIFSFSVSSAVSTTDTTIMFCRCPCVFDFKILFNCYVRSHLGYCVQVWSPHKQIFCIF